MSMSTKRGRKRRRDSDQTTVLDSDVTQTWSPFDAWLWFLDHAGSRGHWIVARYFSQVALRSRMTAGQCRTEWQRVFYAPPECLFVGGEGGGDADGAGDATDAPPMSPSSPRCGVNTQEYGCWSRVSALWTRLADWVFSRTTSLSIPDVVEAPRKLFSDSIASDQKRKSSIPPARDARLWLKLLFLINVLRRQYASEMSGARPRITDSPGVRFAQELARTLERMPSVFATIQPIQCDARTAWSRVSEYTLVSCRLSTDVPYLCTVDDRQHHVTATIKTNGWSMVPPLFFRCATPMGKSPYRKIPLFVVPNTVTKTLDFSSSAHYAPILTLDRLHVTTSCACDIPYYRVRLQPLDTLIYRYVVTRIDWAPPDFSSDVWQLVCELALVDYCETDRDLVDDNLLLPG